MMRYAFKKSLAISASLLCGGWGLLSADVGATGLEPTPSATEPTTLTVAVPDALLMAFDGGTLDGQLTHLNAALQTAHSGYTLKMQTFQASDADSQLARLQPDFVLAQSSLMIAVAGENGTPAYNVASRKAPQAPDAAHSVGGVIVVNDTAKGLKTLSDLEGKRVATTISSSTGWLASLGEVAALGKNPDHFFREVYYLNTPLPNVLSALASGHVEAAVIETCVLEQLLSEQLIDAKGWRILNAKSDDGFHCWHSTLLYPDLTLYAFEWTDEKAVRAVLSALLQNPDGVGEWHVHVSRQAMDALLKTLKLGPFAYLRTVSWSALFERYREEILLGLCLLLLLVANELRLHRLVKRRTAQLSAALEQQQRSENEARQARLTLGSLERRNVVNQMSAMIAHEVRTPLGAITNFASVLQYLLPVTKEPDAPAGIAMQGILQEVKRIGGIVDRVRQYAKSQRSAHVPTDLAGAASAALKVLDMSMPHRLKVNVAMVPEAPVLADALELELLVFNLLKNAVEAAVEVPGPWVTLTLMAQNEQHWLIRVENNGAYLSDEDFAKLSRNIDSVKPEGLGMGLSIVRGIADSHAAPLKFFRRDEGGLRIECTFERLNEETLDALRHREAHR